MPMESERAGQISVQGAHAPGNAAPQRRSLRGWLIGGAIFLIFAGVLIYGILDRMYTSAALRGETATLALPSATVFAPKRAAQSQEIARPGSVQRFTQWTISGRSNGFLHHREFAFSA